MTKKLLYNIAIIFLLFVSCNKTKKESDTSFKILPCGQGFTNYQMVLGTDGNILTYAYSGGYGSIRQQFNLIKPNGDIIKTFSLSDTVFQIIDIKQAIDGGFIIFCSGTRIDFFKIYKLDEKCNIVWTKSRNNSLHISFCKSSDNTSYLNLFSTYLAQDNWIEQRDFNGNVIFSKRVPKPFALHSPKAQTGGEYAATIYQPNDTSIMVEGYAYDWYSSILVSNCFIKSLTENVKTRTFIQDFDSVKSAYSIGTFFTSQNKIFQFAKFTRDGNQLSNTDVFLKIYSFSGNFENEIIYPRVDGKYTTMEKAIADGNGSYLIVGETNVLLNQNVNPNTKIALLKVNANGSFNWNKSINTTYPGWACDAVYMPDGTIGVLAILNEKYMTARLIYLHLDSQGNIIKN